MLRRIACSAAIISMSLLAALAGALPGPGASVASAAEVGVVQAQNTIGNAQATAALHKLHPKWVRFFLPWADAESSRGVYNQPLLQGFSQELAALGPTTKVIIDVTSTPTWESGQAATNVPPANDADYASFVHFVAGYFGSRVAAWEIWNEEDTPLYWSPAPSAAAYTSLLKAAYPAIKSAEPNATVVLGGLVGGDYLFLKEIYANGGAGSFDAVAEHTDLACDSSPPSEYIRDLGTTNEIDQYSFISYQSLHNVMVANGDGGKQIWLTELGWSTDPGICDTGAYTGKVAAGVSEAAQASDLLAAYHCIAQEPYIGVGLWFSLNDYGPSSASRDDFGLLSSDFKPKPAFAALQSEIANGDQLQGPCANFKGPSLTVLSPKPKKSYSGPLPIHVFASSPEKVVRIHLLLNGKKADSWGPLHFSEATTTLNGTLHWQHFKHLPYGKVKLSFVAYDLEGNTTTVSFYVIHKRPPRRRHKH